MYLEPRNIATKEPSIVGCKISVKKSIGVLPGSK
jgi:hypothetical protein